MRRIATAVVLVAAAVAALGLAVSAWAAGETGPKCADLYQLTYNYAQNTDLTYRFGARLILSPEDVPACKQIVYTLTIADVTGNPIVVEQQGNNIFSVPSFADSNGAICVSATAATNGGKVHDMALDTGCLVLTVGTSGGGVGFG